METFSRNFSKARERCVCSQLQKAQLGRCKSHPKWHPPFLRKKITLARHQLDDNHLLCSWYSFSSKLDTVSQTRKSYCCWITVDGVCICMKIPLWSINYGTRSTWLLLERACMRGYNPADNPSPSRVLFISIPWHDWALLNPGQYASPPAPCRWIRHLVWISFSLLLTNQFYICP